MSSHADTIRTTLRNLGLIRYGRFERPQAQEGLVALDALLAENQRYEAALREIEEHEYIAGVECRRIAREALAGDAE